MKPIRTTVSIDGEVLAATIYTNDPFSRDYLEGVSESERPAVATAAFVSGLRGMAAANGNASIIAMSDQVQAAANAAGQHVKNATDAMNQTIRQLAEQFFGPGGKLITGIETAGAKAFDPQNEHVLKLRREFANAALQAIQPALTQIVNTANINDEQQPLGLINRQVRDIASAVIEIKTNLANQAQIAAAVRRDPTFAGRSLEDFFYSKVAPFAAAQGEVLEDVRNETGNIERCKAGDFRTAINTQLTQGQHAAVAVEAKNRRGVSATALMHELERATKNRGCDSALGILTNPTSKFGAILHQRNAVIVSLPDFGDSAADYRLYEELVVIGYEMARFIAIHSVLVPNAESVDLEKLGQCVAELRAAVQRFSVLKDNHTRIVTAVDTARMTADSIRDSVLAIGTKLRGVIEDETAKLGQDSGAGTEAA
jgi:hypothetical protein